MSEKKRGSLGRKLFRYRSDLGLTIPEMCEKIGVPYRTYQDWELGNKAPSAAAKKLIDGILA